MHSSNTSIPESHLRGSAIEFGVMGDDSVLTVCAVSSLFGVHTSNVEVAIARGELPRPVSLMGQSVWLKSTLVRHLETRLMNIAAAQATSA